jgi:ubiquinone/menaquinone biosynthesis C-methylase UbiE
MTARVFETVRPDPIDYLDRLAASDLGRSYKQQMLGMLNVGPGQVALDLGCGPGTDLGALAAAVTEAGMVIGIDHDQAMVDRAAQRTAAHPAVRVQLGDAHSLPLDRASINRARTDRVLQHVDDPVRALTELRRVLRPGGRLVMGEPDWDTLAIDHPNLETARAYTRYIADHAVRNATIGRQLPRLATGAGFSIAAVIPVTPVFRDVTAADRILGIQRNTQRAVAAGYLTSEAAQRWLDHLASELFLAAVTLFITVADVPD